LFLACFYSTGKSCIENQADLDDVKTNNLAKQPTLYNDETNGQSEECCSSNGICSHEVLRDGKPDSDSKMVRKVFYKLLIEAKYVIMIIFVAAGFPIDSLKYLSPMYLCIYTSITILLMFLAPKHR
jgi:hypothetical protein